MVLIPRPAWRYGSEDRFNREARDALAPNERGSVQILGMEEGVGLTKVVPFLVEDELGLRGAKFKKTSDWQSLVVRDGLLITGQNPASSGPTAGKLLEVLGK